VLDRAVAFAVRQRHVGGGHVVLIVDEMLAIVAERLGGGDDPHLAHCAQRRLGAGDRGAAGRLREAGGMRGGRAGGVAVDQAIR
jgi:hypothetical protein